MYYAKFQEIEDEVIAFQTEQERNDFVNFKDEFSVGYEITKDESTFQRESLTEEEARYIIDSYGLTLGDESDILQGAKIYRS